MIDVILKEPDAKFGVIEQEAGDLYVDTYVDTYVFGPKGRRIRYNWVNGQLQIGEISVHLSLDDCRALGKRLRALFYAQVKGC